LANSTAISLDSIVSVAPDQIFCELDGEAAILNLASGAYHGLDSIGAAIWNLLASPIVVGAIVDAIVAEYDVERDRCERDLMILLGQLEERGLIQFNDGAGR
jgi:Coenzyme PQQ synthesis protein D (PqqD)